MINWIVYYTSPNKDGEYSWKQLLSFAVIVMSIVFVLGSLLTDFVK